MFRLTQPKQLLIFSRPQVDDEHGEGDNGGWRLSRNRGVVAALRPRLPIVVVVAPGHIIDSVDEQVQA